MKFEDLITFIWINLRFNAFFAVIDMSLKVHCIRETIK